MSKILFIDTNGEEDCFNRFFARRGQRSPADTAKELRPRMHESKLKLATDWFLLGANLTAARAQAIDGNVAERRQESRFLQKPQFLPAQTFVKP